MFIVTGHLRVDADERDAYVAACRDAVRTARAADGCLDFVVAADPIDPQRVVIVERWVDRDSLMAFRGDGKPPEGAPDILDADIGEYLVTRS